MEILPVFGGAAEIKANRPSGFLARSVRGWHPQDTNKPAMLPRSENDQIHVHEIQVLVFSNIGDE